MSKNYLIGDVLWEGEAAEDEGQASSDGEAALSKCKSMLQEKFSHLLSHTSTRSHAASWTSNTGLQAVRNCPEKYFKSNELPNMEPVVV